MPSLTVLCASLLLATAAMPAAAASPIENLRWKNRVVLIFGADTAQIDSQVEEMLAERAELADREMVVIRVEGDEATVPFGNAPEMDAQTLRDTYGIERRAPITMVLVGKDGGEKLRREELVKPRDIFDLIDSMPMRQSEKG